MKVWLRKVFTPDGGGDPVITLLDPYEWTGTGSPCLADTTKVFSATENKITGSETTENEPTENGTTIVEIVKWSCVPGYIPPDDGSANGYPVP
jgi:hypothetical protein